MKIRLNVRINITHEGKVFTVWPRPNRYLPGVEFYTGMSDSLPEAIVELMESLPQSFAIDDEVCVVKSSLECIPVRPFDIVKSSSQRMFCLC